MESKAGSIILLISSIITLLVGVGYFVYKWLTSGFNPLQLLGVIVIVAFAGAKFYLSRMMKSPEKTKRAGIHAIIIGAISGLDILAIIGGIIAIVQGGKNYSQFEPYSKGYTEK